MAADRLAWNIPGVTSEVFDDEVVIVNFDSGKYHSLQGSALAIWQWLESGPTLDDVMQRARETFAANGSDLDSHVREFVDTLLAEGLVVPAGGESPAAKPFETVAASREPFVPPVLHTFSDMQELLLLDPIHEVDEAGWPVARDPGGN